MSMTRLPTLKAIMAENGCDIDAARSIRARLEVEADRAHFRKTGRHALEVISARDLARHPELAVQDTVRPKLYDWKIDDYLKTPEERAAYIRAAAEEGTPDALPDAFADVFRSMGRTAEATLCESLAAYLRGTAATARWPHKTGGKAVVAGAATRKAAKRKPAMA